MLAKCFVIHRQVNELLFTGHGIQPTHVLLNGETGAALHKTKGDVIAETVITEKDLKVFLVGMTIKSMRTFDAEDFFMTFSKYTAEAHHRYPSSDVITIDQL